MTVEVIDDLPEVAEQSKEITAEVKILEVVDQESYNYANTILEKCNAVLKRLDDVHSPAIAAAHEAHKKAIQAKKEMVNPFENLKKEAIRKMTAWYMVEQRRIADERAAAEKAALKLAEDARIREAEQLAAVGMTEAADAALDAPLAIKEFSPESRGPEKVAGVSYRETWKAECVNLAALVQAVEVGRAPLNYLEANMTALNQAAEAFRGTQEIPGVKQFSETSQAKRMY